MHVILLLTIKWSRGLVVLTLDFESNNRRFDPGRDLTLSFAFEQFLLARTKEV